VKRQFSVDLPETKKFVSSCGPLGVVSSDIQRGKSHSEPGLDCKMVAPSSDLWWHEDNQWTGVNCEDMHCPNGHRELSMISVASVNKCRQSNLAQQHHKRRLSYMIHISGRRQGSGSR
jgi:hypothetical protein